MPPTFSVVMPAYCSAPTVGAAIESVLSQHFTDFELIVVDDGSTDRTSTIVDDYVVEDPRISLVRQVNAGPSAARNTAIGNSAGRFLSFLDSDDAWFPGYLEAVHARFAADSELGLVHADAVTFDEVSERVFHLTTLESYPDVDASAEGDEAVIELLRINFITASTVTVRREALEVVGGFAEDLAGSEDWDLWLRILAAGFRSARAGDHPLALLRERPGSYSKDRALMLRSSIQVLDRFVAAGPPESMMPMTLAQRDGYRRLLEQLESPSRSARLSGAARKSASSLKNTLLRPRDWPPAPPLVTDLARGRREAIR